MSLPPPPWKGKLCDLCGEECDAATDYLRIVDCSRSGDGPSPCPNECNSYHKECLEQYMKKCGTRYRHAGFPCPRGTSTASKHRASPCTGVVVKTHPVEKKKVVKPPPPLPKWRQPRLVVPPPPPPPPPKKVTRLPAAHVHLPAPPPPPAPLMPAPAPPAVPCVGAEFADALSKAQQRNLRRHDKRVAQAKRRDLALDAIRRARRRELGHHLESFGFAAHACVAAVHQFGADTHASIEWLVSRGRASEAPHPPDFNGRASEAPHPPDFNGRASEAPHPPDFNGGPTSDVNIDAETQSLERFLAANADADSVYEAVLLANGDVDLAFARYTSRIKDEEDAEFSALMSTLTGVAV